MEDMKLVANMDVAVRTLIGLGFEPSSRCVHFFQSPELEQDNIKKRLRIYAIWDYENKLTEPKLTFVPNICMVDGQQSVEDLDNMKKLAKLIMMYAGVCEDLNNLNLTGDRTKLTHIYFDVVEKIMLERHTK